MSQQLKAIVLPTTMYYSLISTYLFKKWLSFEIKKIINFGDKIILKKQEIMTQNLARFKLLSLFNSWFNRKLIYNEFNFNWKLN